MAAGTSLVQTDKQAEIAQPIFPELALGLEPEVGERKSERVTEVGYVLFGWGCL
jgi:hypothetical protein